jgi:vacuolar-type H+-ATPase subunit F/Vma7
MARALYIGDEATAAGYRLAGADVRVPDPGEVVETFRLACEEDLDLLLLAAELVEALPAEELQAAMLRERPLVALVSDVHGRHAAPDVAREVRFALGIDA